MGWKSRLLGCFRSTGQLLRTYRRSYVACFRSWSSGRIAALARSPRSPSGKRLRVCAPPIVCRPCLSTKLWAWKAHASHTKHTLSTPDSRPKRSCRRHRSCNILSWFILLRYISSLHSRGRGCLLPTASVRRATLCWPGSRSRRVMCRNRLFSFASLAELLNNETRSDPPRCSPKICPSGRKRRRMKETTTKASLDC